MPTTIEQLELEVQSSSTSAVAGIDALSASLSKLKNAVRGGVGLTSVANQVRNLDTALKSMDSSGADKIDKLASSLEKPERSRQSQDFVFHRKSASKYR